jgi:2-dehydropantoate 2-reductase
MRFVVFGAGAIGGVVGARLHQSGHEVMLIARGAHHDAIAARGLTLKSPVEQVTLSIPVAATAAAAGIGADDVVLLATKSQDTWQALMDLRDAAPELAPAVVLLQNGVENERVALRLFPRVYGAVVMAPTAHLEPGVVLAYGSRRSGRIDLGRIPHGVDQLSEAVGAALERSHFDSTPREDIMLFKYAKLVNNLANAVQAVCGRVDPDGAERLSKRVKEEGREVLRAAKIEFDAPIVADMTGRWERIAAGEIDGKGHEGGSTWQSVVRGAGSVETDYLNGEIALVARQHGLMAPANELLQSLAQTTLRDGHQPGWITASEILTRLDATSENDRGAAA